MTYQCYPGYQVVGAELLMCQWDLTWSGDLPSCERGEYKNTATATATATAVLEMGKMWDTSLSYSVHISFSTNKEKHVREIIGRPFN